MILKDLKTQHKLHNLRIYDVLRRNKDPQTMKAKTSIAAVVTPLTKTVGHSDTKTFEFHDHDTNTYTVYTVILYTT